MPPLTGKQLMSYRIRSAQTRGKYITYYAISCNHVDDAGNNIDPVNIIGYCKCGPTETPYEKYNSLYMDYLNHGFGNLLGTMADLHGDKRAAKMFPAKLPQKSKNYKLHYFKINRLPKEVKEVRHVWNDGVVTRLPLYSEMAIRVRSAIMLKDPDKDMFTVDAPSGSWNFRLAAETDLFYVIADT